jgi:hypothetical protein
MATLARGGAAHDLATVVSPSQDEQAQSPPEDGLIERARQALVGRYGLLPNEAFELLSALARSQQRSIEEFAESVVRTGGRLDGEPSSSSQESVIKAPPLSIARGAVAELVIEAPSAAAAFLLAGSLADYGARAVLDDGIWRVVVQRCSSSVGGVPGALSRVRMWMAECAFPRASVTLDGETYLLEGSAHQVGR